MSLFTYREIFLSSSRYPSLLTLCSWLPFLFIWKKGRNQKKNTYFPSITSKNPQTLYPQTLFTYYFNFCPVHAHFQRSVPQNVHWTTLSHLFKECISSSSHIIIPTLFTVLITYKHAIIFPIFKVSLLPSYFLSAAPLYSKNPWKSCSYAPIFSLTFWSHHYFEIPLVVVTMTASC